MITKRFKKNYVYVISKLFLLTSKVYQKYVVFIRLSLQRSLKCIVIKISLDLISLSALMRRPNPRKSRPQLANVGVGPRRLLLLHLRPCSLLLLMLLLLLHSSSPDGAAHSAPAGAASPPAVSIKMAL